MTLEYIQNKIASLRQSGELDKTHALRIANDIMMTIDVYIQTKKPTPQELTTLYNFAASAYEIASDKVPPKDRDDVAFPSNYWTMRSKQISVTPHIFISNYNNCANFRCPYCGMINDKIGYCVDCVKKIDSKRARKTNLFSKSYRKNLYNRKVESGGPQKGDRIGRC